MQENEILIDNSSEKTEELSLYLYLQSRRYDNPIYDRN